MIWANRAYWCAQASLLAGHAQLYSASGQDRCEYPCMLLLQAALVALKAFQRDAAEFKKDAGSKIVQLERELEHESHQSKTDLAAAQQSRYGHDS
jgi:hypothetical protein